MSAKKPKKRPKYNQNSAVRSAIRRTFSRSPIVREVMQAVRRESKQYNKDGSEAKKPAVRYQCAICKRWFMSKDCAVDHLEPVIPLDGTWESWDKFVERLFCDISNLQVVCSYKLKDNDKHGGVISCHNSKTAEERRIRKENEEKKR